jgi:hypothetical protein
MMAGKKPVFLREALRRLGGELIDISPNLRTTVGIDYTANTLGGTAPGTANWVAISNNTVTPAAGDSSSTTPWSTAQATDTAPSGSTGEWTGLGLTRVLATYAHTNGVASYTQTASWTASGTATSNADRGHVRRLVEDDAGQLGQQHPLPREHLHGDDAGDERPALAGLDRQLLRR